MDEFISPLFASAVACMTSPFRASTMKGSPNRFMLDGSKKTRYRYSSANERGFEQSCWKRPDVQKASPARLAFLMWHHQRPALLQCLSECTPRNETWRTATGSCNPTITDSRPPSQPLICTARPARITELIELDLTSKTRLRPWSQLTLVRPWSQSGRPSFP